MIQHGALVVCAAALGLVVAGWFLDVLGTAAAFASLRPGGMEYQLDARAVTFAMGAAVLVGVVLSIAPIRVALSAPAGSVLREGLVAGGGRSRVQQGFVVVQVAAAFLLLTGGALLAKSAVRLADVDLGFDAAHVVQGSPSYPHPWRVREKYLPVTQAILAELGTLTGVGAAGVRASVPLRGPAGAPEVVLDGGSAPLPVTQLPATTMSVSPGYFAALGIRPGRGRVFTGEDVERGAPVAVVNVWAARHWWPGIDPIGHTVRLDTAPGLPVTLTVIGVVPNNRAAQGTLLLGEEGPELYRPYVQAPTAFPSFVVRVTGDAAGFLKPVRDILVRAVPDRPVSTTLVASTIADQLEGVRVNASQALGVAGAGLLLAILGIYGVLAHSVRRRSREIGICAAMGAAPRDIAGTLLWQAGGLVMLGLAIGVPVARAASRWLDALLYHTSPNDTMVYALVALVIAASAALAAVVPLNRALRVSPLTVLTGERAA